MHPRSIYWGVSATSALGVVYTPPELARQMALLALGPLVAGKSADEILALRVCDPAIGEGAFAIEIVRVLADAIGGRDAKRRAASCVIGADVAADAIATARANIERFVGAPVPALEHNLRVGDALALDWPACDALVANPPYIRQERLGARTKQALARWQAYDGVADLYVYFVELALRIAKRYCLVVPNKWLTAAYGKPLRELLVRHASLERVIDLAAMRVFPDADAFACIVAGGTRPAPLRVARADPAATIESAFAMRGTTRDRARWSWHVDGRSDAALADRLVAKWPPLGAVLGEPPARGVVTGCNRAFVIDANTRERIIDRDPTAAAWLHPFVKGRDVRRWRADPTERYLVLVDRGSDPPPVIRDHLAASRASLEPRPKHHAGAWHGRKPGAYRWFELQDPVGALARSREPRLFYQDIQTAPACCLDPSGALVPDTTVWMLGSSDRFLLAVLNTRLYGWFARRRFPPALNGAVRPKLAYMQALPVAAPAKDLRARIAALVDAQLAEPDPARDVELDGLVCDAYELSRRERLLLQR
ncbi:MAG TPA: Eco57I restriction-modification methylase domain-containing protein [Kofleriaceae bacterium]|jgi:hypothetical protein|nr:Eco57I restriction-modification methylase domain-containing protein [Kofleriaceae bacterium]